MHRLPFDCSCLEVNDIHETSPEQPEQTRAHKTHLMFFWVKLPYEHPMNCLCANTHSITHICMNICMETPTVYLQCSYLPRLKYSALKHTLPNPIEETTALVKYWYVNVCKWKALRQSHWMATDILSPALATSLRLADPPRVTTFTRGFHYPVHSSLYSLN